MYHWGLKSQRNMSAWYSGNGEGYLGGKETHLSGMYHHG